VLKLLLGKVAEAADDGESTEQSREFALTSKRGRTRRPVVEPHPAAPEISLCAISQAESLTTLSKNFAPSFSAV